MSGFRRMVPLPVGDPPTRGSGYGSCKKYGALDTVTARPEILVIWAGHADPYACGGRWPWSVLYSFLRSQCHLCGGMLEPCSGSAVTFRVSVIVTPITLVNMTRCFEMWLATLCYLLVFTREGCKTGESNDSPPDTSEIDLTVLHRVHEFCSFLEGCNTCFCFS